MLELLLLGDGHLSLVRQPVLIQLAWRGCSTWCRREMSPVLVLLSLQLQRLARGYGHSVVQEGASEARLASTAAQSHPGSSCHRSSTTHRHALLERGVELCHL